MFSSRPHLLQTPSSLLNPGALCRYGSTWEKQRVKQPISKTINLLYDTRLLISVSGCRFFNLIGMIIPVQQFELTLNKVEKWVLFVHWICLVHLFTHYFDQQVVSSLSTIEVFNDPLILRRSSKLKSFLSATDKLCFSATTFLSLPEATSRNVCLTYTCTVRIYPFQPQRNTQIKHLHSYEVLAFSYWTDYPTFTPLASFWKVNSDRSLLLMWLNQAFLFRLLVYKWSLTQAAAASSSSKPESKPDLDSSTMTCSSSSIDCTGAEQGNKITLQQASTPKPIT